MKATGRSGAFAAPHPMVIAPLALVAAQIQEFQPGMRIVAWIAAEPPTAAAEYPLQPARQIALMPLLA